MLPDKGYKSTYLWANSLFNKLWVKVFRVLGLLFSRQALFIRIAVEIFIKCFFGGLAVFKNAINHPYNKKRGANKNTTH